MSNAQAGWYDDPESPGYVRWWDGAQWTNVQLLDGMQPQPPSRLDLVMSGLGSLGKLMLLLPLLAFFLFLIWALIL